MFENFQGCFLVKFLRATNVYLYTCSNFLNHITSHWDHHHGHVKVVENIITIQVNPLQQLFRITWEAIKRIPEDTSKLECLGFEWMEYMKKRFRRWDALHLLHDMSIDTSTNEVSLQGQCIVTLEICKHSHFMYCVAYIAPNYKTIFVTKHGNGTRWYMLEPIPSSTICNIPFRWFSSHSLLCKVKCWGHNKKDSLTMHIFPWTSVGVIVSIIHFTTFKFVFRKLSI